MLSGDVCPRVVVRMEVHGEVLNAMVDVLKNTVGVEQPCFCRRLMDPDVARWGLMGADGGFDRAMCAGV